MVTDLKKHLKYPFTFMIQLSQNVLFLMYRYIRILSVFQTS